jgi:hypothetical protein
MYENFLINLIDLLDYYSLIKTPSEKQKEIIKVLNIREVNARHWWLIPVFLATWEAEIGRIVVLSHPREKFCTRPNLNGPECWYTPVIPAMEGSSNKRIMIQVALNKK